MKFTFHSYFFFFFDGRHINTDKINVYQICLTGKRLNCIIVYKKEDTRLDVFNKINEPKWGKAYLPTCAPNEDSDQPAHPRSLIRVFVVRMKKLCILGYPKCDQ